MRDPYLHDDCDVLKNLLGIKEQPLLDNAEADYVVYRLKHNVLNPVPGNFDVPHLLNIHKYLFQDIYSWAGQIRTINIDKEEPALGGLSIQYSDISSIEQDLTNALKNLLKINWKSETLQGLAACFAKHLAALWKIHPFREGNTRTIITFCCQLAETRGIQINRELFEKNSQYLRTALVAYNAVFDDLGDLSKKEYLVRIINDALN